MAAKNGHASGGRGSKSSSTTIRTTKDRKFKAKDSKQMKQIFLGKVFSFSGDFGQNWSHEQMAGWVRAHGGRYEREVSNGTTHLICTTEHYKEKKEQG
jgi:hypothetical protein